MARCQVKQGDVLGARRSAEKARQAARRAAPVEMALAHTAAAFAEAGSYREALDIARTIDDRGSLTIAMADIAVLQSRSKDPGASLTAREALRMAGADPSRLKDSADAWQHLARAWARIGDPAGAWNWAEQLPSPRDRAYALLGLAQGVLQPVDDWERSFAPPDVEHINVVAVLGELQRPGRPLTREPSRVPGTDVIGRDWKKPALEGLVRRGEDVASLIDSLKNGDASMRAAAARSLGRPGLAAGEAVPALVEALRDKEVQVPDAAAAALARVGAVAVPELVKGLKDEEAAFRLAVVQTLGLLGPKAAKAVPALTEALQDSQATVRRYAAVALGKVGPIARQAAPTLVEALKDPDAEVRTAAALALRLIQGRRPLRSQ
jgi:hypothetical protein